jgi:hypothetical protein
MVDNPQLQRGPVETEFFFHDEGLVEAVPYTLARTVVH